MDMFSLVSFAAIMLGLAALPSASVALVVTRSATHGVGSGVATSIGIVVADLLFVALALLGMSVLAESLGVLFAFMRYAAAAYLIWFGVSLLRTAKGFAPTPSELGVRGHVASALAGFALTLGDVKAIVFYAALFPTLFDLASLTAADIALIVVVTIVVLGGVKVAYAITARRLVDTLAPGLQGRASGRLSGQVSGQVPGRQGYGQSIKTVTGGLLIGTGLYLVVRS